MTLAALLLGCLLVAGYLPGSDKVSEVANGRLALWKVTILTYGKRDSCFRYSVWALTASIMRSINGAVMPWTGSTGDFWTTYLFQCPQRMADPPGTAGNSGSHCLRWNLPHRIPEPSNLRNQGSPGTCSFPRPHRLFDLLTVHFSTCVVHTLCLCSSGNGRGCFM